MARTTRPNVNTHRLGTLWVKPELADRLAELATREGRSLSDLMREALSQYLAKNRA